MTRLSIRLFVTVGSAGVALETGAGSASAGPRVAGDDTHQNRRYCNRLLSAKTATLTVSTALIQGL